MTYLYSEIEFNLFGSDPDTETSKFFLCGENPKLALQRLEKFCEEENEWVCLSLLGEVEFCDFLHHFPDEITDIEDKEEMEEQAYCWLENKKAEIFGDVKILTPYELVDILNEGE